MIYNEVTAVLLALDGHPKPKYFAEYGAVCINGICRQTENLTIFIEGDVFVLLCDVCKTSYVTKVYYRMSGSGVNTIEEYQ